MTCPGGAAEWRRLLTGSGAVRACGARAMWQPAMACCPLHFRQGVLVGIWKYDTLRGFFIEAGGIIEATILAAALKAGSGSRCSTTQIATDQRTVNEASSGALNLVASCLLPLLRQLRLLLLLRLPLNR